VFGVLSAITMEVCETTVVDGSVLERTYGHASTSVWQTASLSWEGGGSWRTDFFVCSLSWDPRVVFCVRFMKWRTLQKYLRFAMLGTL
jgi:hypothetical protein